MSLALDSVIIIDHLNAIQLATEFILRNKSRVSISVITRAEVLVGYDPRHAGQVRQFLDLFPTLPITVEIADAAAELRRKYRWKLPDALQAAAALHHKMKLVTRNTKDFPPHRHEFVMIPYDL